MAVKESQEKTQKPNKVKESVYPVKEIISASEKLFGVKREVTKAALKLAGKHEDITVSEAKRIVNEFKKKGVK